MTPRGVGFVLVAVALSVCATGARHVNHERHLTPGRHANERAKAQPQRVADYRGSDMPRYKTDPRLVSAPSDTFVLGEFSFDAGGAPDVKGWYSVDRTAQTEIFTHVADSNELSGGFFGSLVPIAGQQSLWCGTAGNTFGTCYYAAPPGYGNGWRQTFTSKPFAYTGGVRLEYLIRYDIEPGYDALYVKYKDENDVWKPILVTARFLYDGDSGRLTIFESFDLSDSSLADSIQIQFEFTSNSAWSGEDGLWPTDGAYLLDSLMIIDSLGVLTFQDFESEPVGALVTNDGHWVAGEPTPFGDFAGLFPGVMVLQEDGCRFNATSLWAFFAGSTETYACGGNPGQTAVPRTSGDGLYLNNEIWSPLIDWDVDEGGASVPASANFALLEFDVYRDLPRDNLVFYVWSIRSIFSGCPSRAWRNENLVYDSPTPNPDWFRASFEVGQHVEPGADQVQLAIGARDMCGGWCGVFGTGSCHSHSPLIDNVRLVRVNVGGPAWIVKAFDLFQDDFPADGTRTGKVRMDSAVDVGELWLDVRPGDTLFVDVASPDGIDFHTSGIPSSGPAVYCHVKDVSVGKSGSVVSGDLVNYPIIATSGGWTVLQFDTSMTLDPWNNPIVGGFEVDLNDNLYDPGDTVYYYFSARDANGETTYWTSASGITDEAGAIATAMEVTCLPANNTDILYIDDADGHGVQPLFESAFQILGITPDRYDVLAPTSYVGNGPGRRVRNAVVQITNGYKKIIWSTGNLISGLVGDGQSWNLAESNDFAMLLNFLDQGANGPGVFFSGDGIAAEWVVSGNEAITLRSTYMNFDLVNSNHTAVGEPVSPFVVGEPGSCFDHGAVDTLIAFGGCPRASFSVLGQTGASVLEMTYSGNSSHGAVLSQITVNSVGDTARVILSGFSAHIIHDDRVQNPTDRVEHLADVIRWLQNDLPTPTTVRDPVHLINDLAQNYPNPFNPITTIRYSIVEAGQVTVVVFNVAGQRVRTLVDEFHALQSQPFVVRWDGTNQSGDPVSSGIYYYRLNAPHYSATRKMVLLK